MEIFTGHYGRARRPPTPPPRLFKRANPTDGPFDPLDRNDL